MTTLRDQERFKDKIEVSLDSRQIFFLFFGGAIVACLVFVLGVMVGRRLEGREQVARKATTSAALDPLAALDELGADEQKDEVAGDLAFPNALAGGADKAQPLGDADTAPAAPPPPVAAPLPAPPPPEKVKDAKKDEKKKDRDKDKAGKDDKKKTRFTLQISSFQEQTEADSFLAKLTAAGYQPYVVTSEVPERGLFYRVRIGEFDTHDDALVAKTEFEKKEHIIAYVTRL